MCLSNCNEALQVLRVERSAQVLERQRVQEDPQHSQAQRRLRGGELAHDVGLVLRETRPPQGVGGPRRSVLLGPTDQMLVEN